MRKSSSRIYLQYFGEQAFPYRDAFALVALVRSFLLAAILKTVIFFTVYAMCFDILVVRFFSHPTYTYIYVYIHKSNLSVSRLQSRVLDAAYDETQVPAGLSVEIIHAG